MKISDQLIFWFNGHSFHDDERDQCCPDFSCCNSKIDTPISVRKQYLLAFLDGDKKTLNHWNGVFLRVALNTIEGGQDVHIIGPCD